MLQMMKNLIGISKMVHIIIHNLRTGSREDRFAHAVEFCTLAEEGVIILSMYNDAGEKIDEYNLWGHELVSIY